MNCTGENFIVVLWFITEKKPDKSSATQSVRHELWLKFESAKSMKENFGQQVALRLMNILLSKSRDTRSNIYSNNVYFQWSLFSNLQDKRSRRTLA